MFKFLQSLIQRPKIYPKTDNTDDKYENTICRKQSTVHIITQLHTIQEEKDNAFVIRRYFESEY